MNEATEWSNVFNKLLSNKLLSNNNLWELELTWELISQFPLNFLQLKIHLGQL